MVPWKQRGKPRRWRARANRETARTSLGRRGELVETRRERAKFSASAVEEAAAPAISRGAVFLPRPPAADRRATSPVDKQHRVAVLAVLWVMRVGHVGFGVADQGGRLTAHVVVDGRAARSRRRWQQRARPWPVVGGGRSGWGRPHRRAARRGEGVNQVYRAGCAGQDAA